RAHVDVRISDVKIARDLDGLLVTLDCFVQFALPKQSHAEVVVRKMIVRGHLQRVTKEGDAIPPIRRLHGSQADTCSERSCGSNSNSRSHTRIRSDKIRHAPRTHNQNAN